MLTVLLMNYEGYYTRIIHQVDAACLQHSKPHVAHAAGYRAQIVFGIVEDSVNQVFFEVHAALRVKDE